MKTYELPEGFLPQSDYPLTVVPHPEPETGEWTVWVLYGDFNLVNEIVLSYIIIHDSPSSEKMYEFIKKNQRMMGYPRVLIQTGIGLSDEEHEKWINIRFHKSEWYHTTAVNMIRLDSTLENPPELIGG